ncbi:hypothetical protein ACFWAT_19395 [Streptomyces syringium]|uniref:hypothetical protein n=1 Tax=Streptomyces syringium TaxID=76729 RepID=UPI00365F1409
MGSPDAAGGATAPEHPALERIRSVAAALGCLCGGCPRRAPVGGPALDDLLKAAD